jgi:hypothetical protein
VILGRSRLTRPCLGSALQFQYKTLLLYKSQLNSLISRPLLMQPLMQQWRQRCLPSSDSATALVWLTLDSAPAFIWLKSTDVAFLPRILLLLSSNLLWILLCICPNLEHQLYNTRANLTLCIASVADDNNAWFDTPTTRPTRSKRRCPNATVYFGPSRPKSYWSDWIHIRWLCCLQTTNSMSTRIITDNPINSAMKRHSLCWCFGLITFTKDW